VVQVRRLVRMRFLWQPIFSPHMVPVVFLSRRSESLGLCDQTEAANALAARLAENANFRPRRVRKYLALRTESLPLLSGKKIRYRNSGQTRHNGQDRNLRRVPDEKKGRIPLVKNNAGKKPVPGNEKHEQETGCGTNRHPQRPAVSSVPAIRAAQSES